MVELTAHNLISPITVLVVEDQPRLRGMLIESLGGLGFVSQSAASAEEAIGHLQSQPIDILLCDHHLPARSGIDLMTIVRERTLPAQMILMTAFPELTLAQSAIRLEAVDFLVKPFQLGELESALARAAARVKQSRLEQATRSATPAEAVESARSLEAVERLHIERTIRQQQGNLAAVARSLGLSRSTLYEKLRRYRLHPRA
ncbi:MAG: response regulator [Tepidisphaeraceae bacterium]